MLTLVREMNIPGLMRNRSFAVLLFLMMVLVSGCSRQMVRTEKVKALIGTTWRASEINGVRVVFLPRQQLDISLVLYRQGHIRGYTGCNSFMGRYSRNADLLSFTPAERTDMRCSPEIMAREREFIKALREVSRYEISGSILKLFSKDGRKVVELIAVRAY